MVLEVLWDQGNLDDPYSQVFPVNLVLLSYLAVRGFRGCLGVLGDLHIPLPPLALDILDDHCLLHLQELEGSDLDPQSHQCTLDVHLAPYTQDLHKAPYVGCYSPVQADQEVQNHLVGLLILGDLWVLVAQVEMNHSDLEGPEDLYILYGLGSQADPSNPDLWSPCPLLLLSVRPDHEVPADQEDLGVQGSPDVLEAHQLLGYQADLEHLGDPWDLRDQSHLSRQGFHRNLDVLCILSVLELQESLAVQVLPSAHRPL